MRTGVAEALAGLHEVAVLTLVGIDLGYTFGWNISKNSRLAATSQISSSMFSASPAISSARHPETCWQSRNPSSFPLREMLDLCGGFEYYALVRQSKATTELFTGRASFGAVSSAAGRNRSVALHHEGASLDAPQGVK